METVLTFETLETICKNAVRQSMRPPPVIENCPFESLFNVFRHFPPSCKWVFPTRIVPTFLLFPVALTTGCPLYPRFRSPASAQWHVWATSSVRWTSILNCSILWVSDTFHTTPNSRNLCTFFKISYHVERLFEGSGKFDWSIFWKVDELRTVFELNDNNHFHTLFFSQFHHETLVVFPRAWIFKQTVVLCPFLTFVSCVVLSFTYRWRSYAFLFVHRSVSRSLLRFYYTSVCETFLLFIVSVRKIHISKIVRLNLPFRHLVPV
jgi:hypothetical protein